MCQRLYVKLIEVYDFLTLKLIENYNKIKLL